jgi:hypothetical protein
VFPLNLYARVRFLIVQLAHETAGAARTRSSLRPALYEGETTQSSGGSRRENADAYPLGSLKMNQEFYPRRPGLEPGPIRRGLSVRALALDTFCKRTAAAYGSRRSPGRRREHSSRQLALAAQPQPLFGFQLYHRQQIVEHAELVAPGELGQFGNGLPDEGRGLIRAALPIRFLNWLLVPGSPIPARSCALPAVPNPAQKTCIQIYVISSRSTPIRTATLGRISQLFRYKVVTSRTLFNICRFDRGPLNTHVRLETVVRESRRTNLKIFP